MITRNRANRKLGVSIAWQPVDDVYFHLAAMLQSSRDAMPIYVTQRVLTDVESFCRGGGASFVYGLLSGELCADPKSGREYVLLDGVAQGTAYAGSAAGWDYVAANLETLATDAAHQGKVPIGWYRGITSIGSAIARDAVAFHRARFTAPWHVMLAVEQGPNARGRFVRVEPSDGRPYSTPFFELVSRDALRRGGKLGTVVAWENYTTTDDVVRLETRPASPVVTTAAPTAARSHGRLADTLTTLRGTLRQATDPPQHAGADGKSALSPGQSVVTRPGASPPSHTGKANPTTSTALATLSQRPAQRPPVTFPLLVPARSPWARSPARPLLRLGMVCVAAGLLTVGAFLAYRLVAGWR